jgi:hypothetical protein
MKDANTPMISTSPLLRLATKVVHRVRILRDQQEQMRDRRIVLSLGVCRAHCVEHRAHSSSLMAQVEGLRLEWLLLAQWSEEP